ncbi:NAD+ synthase [Candidatus Margulisiibacteriota bacterium]
MQNTDVNKEIRVALAQINTIVGDLQGNKTQIMESIKKAEAAGCDLILFPELVITGYPAEDLLLKPHFINDAAAELQKIAAEVNDIVAVVGAVEQDEQGRVFNTAAVLYDRKIQGAYRKILLPNYSVFDEQRYFTPGSDLSVIEMNGVRMALTICEDIWQADGPAIQTAQSGETQIVLNLSSSPYHLGKGLERENILIERAKQTKNIVCYANLAGGQDELVFDGESLVMGAEGKVLARGKQFEEDLIIVDLRIPVGAGSKPASEPAGGNNLQVIKIDKSIPESRDPVSSMVVPRLYEVEEVYQALVLGIRDYVRKNGFGKVVLGLSGGIDSALAAVIAVEALGKENVICVSMPSQYSSEGTKQDARLLAENLGVEFKEISITNVFEAMTSDLEPFFEDLPPDTAEENLQARIRGNILMALSNKFGWLVISTGNKSEVATGYCTLYGDMVGGFNVLKDVSKTLVYKLANWINENDALSHQIPVSIISRPPSAELSPDQRDQDSLPDYDTLDRVLEFYVENDLSFDEIVSKGFAEEIIRKVINLVDNNEYKRRQAAPGVKISPKAFGKDRRMPLTNKYRI